MSRLRRDRFRELVEIVAEWSDELNLGTTSGENLVLVRRVWEVVQGEGKGERQ